MTYDFNRVYDPLPVLDQGTDPNCTNQTRVSLVNAWMRIWRAKNTDWTTRNVTWQTDPADTACAYIAHTPDGDFTIRNGSCEPHWTAATTPAEMRELLNTNGVAQVSVPGSSRTFVQAWSRRKHGHWKLPLVRYAADNGPTVRNHTIFAVGWRKHGVIVQNSWGYGWGKKGRAILTWTFLREYGCVLLPYSFDGHPTGTVHLPG